MTDPGPSFAQYNPRKRPKLEPDVESDLDDVDQKPFVNHPTLYFDDGNVILTTGSTLFCVHRSLLSKHSPIFRELFEHEHDRFRDLMQITMEETPEDLEALLNVIYDGLRFDAQDFELTVETFPTFATLLRMSKRYQIEKPCRDIVARICAEWPSTLTLHDAKEARISAERAKEAEDVKKQQPALFDNFARPQIRSADDLAHDAISAYLLQVQQQRSSLQPPPPVNPGRSSAMMGGGPFPAYGSCMNNGMVMGGLRMGAGMGMGMGMGPAPAPNAIAGPSNWRAPTPAPAPGYAPPPAPAPAPAPVPPVKRSPSTTPESEEDLVVHPASVIGLLRECGYADPQVLFPLFYALSRTTWQFGGPALGHHLAPLSAVDMERFVVGVERVREHYTSFAAGFPALGPQPHHPGSIGQGSCHEGIGQLWCSVVTVLLVGRNERSLAREPLEELTAVVPNVSAQCARHRVCAACGRALVGKIEGFRRELWAKLPQFFELA